MYQETSALVVYEVSDGAHGYSIFEEYRRFSYPKSRAADQQFIELFDLAGVVLCEQLYLPDWPEIRDDGIQLRARIQF
jgi:hypothetical protein